MPYRPQFTLRTLLIVVTLASIGFSWFGWRYRLYRQEEQVIATLGAEGAHVICDDARLSFAGIPLTARESAVEFLHGQADLRTAVKLQRLKYLFMYDGIVAEESHVALSHMQSLLALGFSRMDVVDDIWRYVGALEGLSYLSLMETRITDQGLKALSPLGQLQTLYLVNCGVTDDGLRHLASMKGLVEVMVAKAAIKGDGLLYLSELPKLEILHLRCCELDDSHFPSSITGFPSLRDLELDNNHISNGMLRSLSSLSGLKHLVLSDTDITDEGLECLVPLADLEYLELNNTSITDKGLDTLESLKNLKTLGLKGTAVTAKRIAKLQETLPDLATVP